MFKKSLIISSVLILLVISIQMIRPLFAICQETVSEQDLNEQYLQVLRSIGAEKYDEAIEGCKDIIEKHPSFDRAYLKLVSAYKEKNELDIALKYFEDLLAENPENPFAYHGLGLVYETKKEYDKAIENYKKSLQLSPEYIRGYSYLVSLYKDLKKLDEATKYVNDIIKTDTNNAAAHFGLGFIYQLQMKWEKALERLNMAVKLNPNLPEVYYVIENIYSNTSRYEDCLRINKEGLALAEKNNDLEFKGKFLANIGIVYLDLSKYTQALEYFKKALDIAKEIGNKKSKENQLGNMGSIYWNLGNYPKALEFYEQALKIARKTEDRRGEARHLLNIGHVYHVMSNYPKALEYYEQVLKVVREIGYKSLEENIFNSMGAIYGVLADYPKALDYYQKSLKINIETGNKNGEGIGLTNIGIIYGILDDYSKALDYFQRALKIFADTGNKRNQSSILNNIGNVYRLLGHYAEAIEYQKKALKIDEEIGHKRGMGKDFVNIGNGYFRLGDYLKALEYYQKALKINTEIGDKQTVAISLSNISQIYKRMRDLPKALDYCERTLEIEREIGDREGESTTLSNIGRIHYALGDFSTALDYYQQSLKIASDLGLKSGEAGGLSNIGIFYANKSHYDKALEYFEKSLSIKIEIFGEKHPDVARSFHNIGDVYYQQNDFDKALYYCQKAILSLATDFKDSSIYINPPLKNISSEVNLLSSLKLKAEVFEKLYFVRSNDLKDLQMSFSTYQLAAELIDKMRSGYKAEGSKLFLGEEAAGIYHQAIHTALRLYDLTKNTQYKEQAFVLAEKSKSAVLREALSDSKAKQFAGIPDSLLEKERDLRIDLAYYDTQIQKEKQKKDGRDSLKIADFESRYFTLNRQYEKLIAEFEKTYPKYYDLKYQTQTPSVQELQQVLDSKTALVEYSVGDSLLFIFVLSDQAFEVVSVPIDSTFEQSVSQFSTSIKKLKKNTFLESSALLYNKLIQPIAEYIAAKEKLVIIPAGRLHYIPFEALAPQGTLLAGKSGLTAKVNFAELDYLVRRFEISYHYSATLFAKHSKAEPQTRLAAAGDFVGFAPVFSDSADNGQILAMHRSVFDTTYAAALRSVTVDGVKLNEIKYTEDEVQSIVELFRAKKRPSLGYFYRDASEENFKSEVSQYKYVHIATHGLLNEAQPKLSAIVFSQSTDSSFSEDGVLYAGETYNLNVNADLVVLSSCESGIGKLVKGEGLMALTRGFLYAGAPNIIVSLWKVFDIYSKELMVEFYRNVISGQSYSEALRQAKLAMLKDEATAFPSMWSAFVLVGR